MASKTLIYGGIAAAVVVGGLVIYRRRAQAATVAKTQTGGQVPAALSTIARQSAPRPVAQVSSVAKLLTSLGSRSLSTGSVRGAPIAPIARAVIAAKPAPKPAAKKKKGFFGKIAGGVTKAAGGVGSLGKGTLNFAARNRTLSTGIATAIGGPGAGASVSAGLALYGRR